MADKRSYTVWELDRDRVAEISAALTGLVRSTMTEVMRG